MPKHFGVSEVARLRGVTLQHIYNMLRAGRIPGARKIGRTWRIPAAAIEVGGRIKAQQHARGRERDS